MTTEGFNQFIDISSIRLVDLECSKAFFIIHVGNFDVIGYTIGVTDQIGAVNVFEWENVNINIPICKLNIQSSLIILDVYGYQGDDPSVHYGQASISLERMSTYSNGMKQNEIKVDLLQRDGVFIGHTILSFSSVSSIEPLPQGPGKVTLSSSSNIHLQVVEQNGFTTTSRDTNLISGDFDYSMYQDKRSSSAAIEVLTHELVQLQRNYDYLKLTSMANKLDSLNLSLGEVMAKSLKFPMNIRDSICNLYFEFVSLKQKYEDEHDDYEKIICKLERMLTSVEIDLSLLVEGSDSASYRSLSSYWSGLDFPGVTPVRHGSGVEQIEEIISILNWLMNIMRQDTEPKKGEMAQEVTLLHQQVCIEHQLLLLYPS